MVPNNATMASSADNPKFLADTNIEFHQLDIGNQFKSLTRKQKSYAHWMSRYHTPVRLLQLIGWGRTTSKIKYLKIK